MNEEITLLDDVNYQIRKQYLSKLFDESVKKELRENTWKWDKVY